jgi:hypothetical protein
MALLLFRREHMGNEDTLDAEMPEMQKTADEGLEELPASNRSRLTPEDEDDEEAGYGYGV